MKIKVYGLSCTSTRKAKRWFESHKIPYVYKNIIDHPLSVHEIQQILQLTDTGTEEIITTRSKIYQQLNLNLDKLSLPELYEYIQKYPKLLRSPIMLNENKLQIGFNEHDIRQFIPREERQKQLFNIFNFNTEPQIEGL